MYTSQAARSSRYSKVLVENASSIPVQQCTNCCRFAVSASRLPPIPWSICNLRCSCATTIPSLGSLFLFASFSQTWFVFYLSSCISNGRLKEKPGEVAVSIFHYILQPASQALTVPIHDHIRTGDLQRLQPRSLLSPLVQDPQG